METLAAKPIAAVEDVEQYIEQLASEPEVSSVLSVLATAVPTPIQDAIENAPISFLENLITATALPTWITAIPAPIQSDIGSVINEGLSIIASDLEATGPVTGKPKIPVPTGIVGSGGSAQSTGAVGGGGYNGTKATGTPVPYKGAAKPVKEVAVGVTALVAAGAGFWLLA